MRGGPSTAVGRGSGLLFAVGLVFAACGGDGGKTDTAAATGNASASNTAGTAGTSGSASTGGDSVCTAGCMATVEAACMAGPATQAKCEQDCEMLRAGMCGMEYEAFLACGEGKSVSCDPNGIPTVVGCETEQTAFLMCMSG